MIRPARVCLIVDHPARDLHGLVLLAYELVRRGVVVFLVPLHEYQEVHLLSPDLVVVNFVKSPYLSFLRQTRRLGIKVVVLDTEGGGMNVESFVDRVSPYLHLIDQYCLWGAKQYEALATRDPEKRALLKLTGCPRYDYVALPWRNALRSPSGLKPGYVLVNTNFPLINPRFQSTEREVAQMASVLHVSEKCVRERARQTLIAFDEMVSTVRYLATALPNVVFLLRPHPFEAVAPYEKLLRDLSNVAVRGAGSVFEALTGAVAVVHHNCQTAIDASMMGVESIHLAWLKTPHLELPIASSVSRHAGSREDLERMIQDLVAGRVLPSCAALAQNRARVVREWFYDRDGRASARVADVLDEVLRSEGGVIGRLRAVATLLLGGGRIRSILQAFAILALGSRTYRALRDRLGTDLRAKEKSFGMTEVREILDRLCSIDGLSVAVEVRPAALKDSHVPVRGSLVSLRISADEAFGANKSRMSCPKLQPNAGRAS